jgi:exosortase E/protease (VPEID-CTERM system)
MMRVLFRGLALSTLLLLEIFCLTIRFDTKQFDLDPRWWAAGMAEVYWLPRFAIALAAAALLFAAKDLWQALPGLASELQPARRGALILLAHGVSCAAFTWVTALIFDNDTTTLANAGFWVVAWWLLGILSVVLLALAAFPLRTWLRTLWRGRRVLAAAFALALAACAFAWATDLLWKPLAQGTLWTVSSLLRLLPVQSVADPACLEVGTPSFRVVIAPGCSGYEGIGLFWAFSACYFWLFRKSLRFPQAVLLIPLGTVLMWCCNALRIFGLVVVGTWGSREVALGGFHSQIGWLTFNAVALGLVAGSQRLGFLRKSPVATECGDFATIAGKVETATAAYLAPFLAVLATGMISTAFTAGFDYYYPLRLIAGGAVLYHYRRSYSALRPTWSWGAVTMGAGVFAVWTALALLQEQSGVGTVVPDALAQMGRFGAAIWLVFRLLGYLILTPLVEELAFRGYLTTRIISVGCEEAGRFTWLSFVLSSLLFGFFHQGHWLAASVAGMAYALALYRRRQLSDAVLAHATTNALIAGYVLMTGRWSILG